MLYPILYLDQISIFFCGGSSSLQFFPQFSPWFFFVPFPNPTPSMYDIFTHIWLIFMVNVGKYTIHGSYGNEKLLQQWHHKKFLGFPDSASKNYYQCQTPPLKLTKHRCRTVRPFGPCRSSTSEWTNTSLEVSIGGWKNTTFFFFSPPQVVGWVFGWKWVPKEILYNYMFFFCIAILNIMFVLSSW